MLDLSPTQAVLLALLRGEEPKHESIDWESVLKEAEKQAVTLMLSGSPFIPEPILTSRASKMDQHTISNMRAFFAVSEMNRIMQDANQPYIILKGLAAASYYPDYFMRALGDVDFLIDRPHQAEVEQALTAAGYQNWNTPHICHVVFRKKNQHFEMHFEIPGIPHGKPGEIVRQYMQGVLEETEKMTVKNKEYSLPIPKYHGLILLLHMQHHMLSEGIGLRHLIDWCYFVNQTEGERFWKTDLLPVLKDIGLLYFAAVMTKTGSIYLHTAAPDWCKDADESLCDAVMEDILIGGNFGRKNADRSQSGMMISDHGKDGTKHGRIYHLWRTSIKAAEINWPFVKEIPVLYAAFIPFVVIRRCARVMIGKRKPLYRSLKYVDERKSVYEQLHVFEV